MAIVIAGPGTDGGESWAQDLQQRATRSRGAAVVGDLEQVPAPAISLDHLQQVGIAVLLEITGEQDPLLAEPDAEHDGGVVDAATRAGGGRRQPIPRRPQHLDGGCTEREGRALEQADPTDVEPSGRSPQFAHAGAVTVHPGLCDAAHGVARHQARQATRMVLVGMGQHDQVDVAVPDGDALVEPSHQQVGVRPAVDQEASAVCGLDQDGIPLPDVEDRDPEQSFGAGHQHRPEASDEEY